MWDEINYRFPIFNLPTVEVWEWISNFTQHFTGHVIMDYWEKLTTLLWTPDKMDTTSVLCSLFWSPLIYVGLDYVGTSQHMSKRWQKSFSRLICDHVNWDVIWVPRGRLSFMRLGHNLCIPVYIIEMKLWHFSVFLDNLLPSLGKICFNMTAYVACSTGQFRVITWLHVTVMVKWPKSSSKHMEIVHQGKS